MYATFLLWLLSELFQVMPEVGGETHFADMYRAYERLSPTWKTRLEGMRAVHNLDFSRTRRHGRDLMTEAQRREAPPVDQPTFDGLNAFYMSKAVREAGLTFEHFHVDDAARRLVRFPKSMDVVLSMNLYADILSDLGAETAGGLGLAPSGCFGDGWAYFESVHGSAPDIAGRGIANPMATMLAGSMMLDFLGERMTKAMPPGFQLKGKSAEVRKIADNLIAAKGVKHGRLTITTSGPNTTSANARQRQRAGGAQPDQSHGAHFASGNASSHRWSRRCWRGYRARGRSDEHDAEVGRAPEPDGPDVGGVGVDQLEPDERQQPEGKQPGPDQRHDDVVVVDAEVVDAGPGHLHGELDVHRLDRQQGLQLRPQRLEEYVGQRAAVEKPSTEPVAEPV